MENELEREEEHDTERPAQLCGKKKRAAGHILHCDKELGHDGACAFEEDYEP